MMPGQPIEFREHHEDDATVLAVAGELDLATVPALVARLDGALAERPSELRLDLTAVTFAASALVAALIRCRRLAFRQGTSLVLVAGEGAVRRLLHAGRLERIFDLVPPVGDHGVAGRSRGRQAGDLLIAAEPAGSATRIRLRGELDLLGADALAATFEGLRRDRTDVVVDLRDLAFCDSSGLVVLLRAAEAARRDGLSLTLTHPTQAVRELLVLTGTAAALPLAEPLSG